MKQWTMVLLLAACSLHGEDGKPRPRWRTVLYRTSVAALTAATAADVGSSMGGREMTPFLRSGDGRFGAQGAAIKFGLLGGIVAAEHWIRKKHPGAEAPFTVFNASMAVVSTKIAIQNVGIQRRSGR